MTRGPLRPAAAMALLLAAGLAPLAGCDTRIPPCPGDAQATLTFAGQAVLDGTTCTFVLDAMRANPAAAPTTSFPAIVSWLDAATAAVCIQRPITTPKTGPRSATDPDAFQVDSALPVVELTGCPCGVSVEETLAGRLVRADGGRVTGFSGTLVTRLARRTDETATRCYADADAQGKTAQCPAAPTPGGTPADGSCTVRYLLPPP